VTETPTAAREAAAEPGGLRQLRRGAQAVSVVLVLALLGLLVYDVTHSSAGRIASEVDSQHAVAAWPFTRPRVGAPGSVSLSAFHGKKVVVLNFWQSYCPPCTSEAPVVSAAAKRWASRGVVFVGVDEQDLPGPATAFMRRFHINYPVIADDGPLIGHYGVTGYPETFFIDRHGMVVPMPPTDGQVGHIIGAATPATLAAGIRTAMSR
jgi:cytochrome c biogenesis protein CcmG/thiol:disulfide interchange protein DsbE